MPETHSAPSAVEFAPQPALETSTVAEPCVDFAADSSADRRIVTEGWSVEPPACVFETCFEEVRNQTSAEVVQIKLSETYIKLNHVFVQDVLGLAWLPGFN